MISTPTGSWIRSRQRRDRIQPPVGVEIIVGFFITTGRESVHISTGLQTVYKILLNFWFIFHGFQLIFQK